MNRTAAQAAVADAKTAVATAAAAYVAAKAAHRAAYAAAKTTVVGWPWRSGPSIVAESAAYTATLAAYDVACGVVDDAQVAYDVARTTYRSTAAAASAVTG